MNLAQPEGQFSDPTGQFWICDPVAFMHFAAQQLVALGVDADLPSSSREKAG